MPHRTRPARPARPARVVALGLAALYALLVAHLTLTAPGRVAWAWSLATRVADRVALHAVDRTLSAVEVEALANVALFVPLGFLLAVATGRAWAATALCAWGSVAVELAQRTVVPDRVATLDDVVHNSLGGLLGALAAVVLTALVVGARTLDTRRRTGDSLDLSREPVNVG